MYAAGIRTFVEVGPGARLSGIVKAILGDRDFAAVAVDSSSGKRSGVADLARTLAQLAALGHTVRIAAWDGTFQPPAIPAKKPAMTVPLCGANYVKPKTRRAPAPPRSSTPAELLLPLQAAPHTALPAFPRGHRRPPLPACLRSAATSSSESLRATRESMSVLQKMQEETAQLHRRFLEGQETAARTFQTLLEHQQRILQNPAQAAAVTACRGKARSTGCSGACRTADSGDTGAHGSRPAAPAPSLPGRHVTDILLAVISEKTGYPTEMLDLDMGMESDLGIDSIKRVEILSALQERLPGAPVIGPEQLGTLRTLGEIAGFLGAASGLPGAVPAAAVAPRPCQLRRYGIGTVAETLIAVVSEKTGYPVEMLDLDMGMESDLGIDSIKRVEILSTLQERLPGAPAIGRSTWGPCAPWGRLPVISAAAAFLSQLPRPRPGRHGSPCRSLRRRTAWPRLSLLWSARRPATRLRCWNLTWAWSDLGIDSIKRVEILSALQERLPGAPVIGPEHLGTLRTLGEIARHLEAQPPATVAPVATSVPTPPPEPAAPASAPAIARSAVVPMPPRRSNRSRPVSLTKAGAFWVTGDGSPFTVELCTLLEDRGFVTRLVSPGEHAEIPASGEIAGIVIAAPVTGTDDQFLEDALMLLKSTAPALRQAATHGGALCVTVSRLDGAFGFGTGTTCSTRCPADFPD